MEYITVLLFDYGVEVFRLPRHPTTEEYKKCVTQYRIPQSLWDLAYATGYKDGQRQVEACGRCY